MADYRVLPYKGSLALFTDLYELTMGQVYWSSRMHEREAVFHLTFRRNPFGGGYAVACGLEAVIDYLRAWRFDDQDVRYLANFTGSDGKRLFDEEYLRYLREVEFACDVDAVPEGTVVFSQEPIVRVRGPLIQAQVIETALLTLINFQTLIATKSVRVCRAAGNSPVLEFGARRAQGIDGAYSATRAAYIGGCAGTSNVWAAQRLGLAPDKVKGTMAHSLVMSFDTEPQAFAAYTDALPNNAIYLVDTYDSIQGVRHAIEAGRRLRARGYDLAGIRLDSGDLAALSREARRLLDDAGFSNAVIVASNDLDERLIESLRRQGAAIDVWAVGTKLVTAADDPALGGVYKLSALEVGGGGDASGTRRELQPKIKLSEQPIKTSTPGVLQVRRYFHDAGEAHTDCLYDIATDLQADCTLVHPLDATRRKRIAADTPHADLLIPVFRCGELVYDPPTLDELRERCRGELARLPEAVKRFDNPAEYPTWLEASLYERKMNFILAQRGAREEHVKSDGYELR